ncbi:MAG: GH1 family beta-glucosidase [Opitutaceae bacterium]|nr:GH1 family beta-glucosidase [Opitutaceae bacterium]
MAAYSYQSPFPDNFVFGFAAAAPQIEGAAFEDGKGPSVWDHFARIPGKVLGGDTLDVACDHYHLYPRDFALMQSLGIRHYRLSIAWPRFFPKGEGEVNPLAISFYRKLIQSMLDHGITPWVTLFHWDLPQALDEKGGWASRATVDAFANYANVAVESLSDLVKNWITLNEIRCFTHLAHETCTKAPGRKVSKAELNQMYHHALLAHGHAVSAVRKFGGPGARVGLTDNPDISVPVMETEADIAAARAWFADANAHILGALFDGKYSDSYLKRCGADAPQVKEGDFAIISQPTDFLGLNIYSGSFVRAAKAGGYERLEHSEFYPTTSCAWLKVVPQSIYWGLRHCSEIYGVKSLYITENGCGYDDDKVVNGEVLDLHRRDFLRAYLREVHRSIGDGVPVDGYFLWSFVDNYEWEDGYRRRFGVVHCDFETQVRTPKLSARYFAEVVRTRRIV